MLLVILFLYELPDSLVKEWDTLTGVDWFEFAVIAPLTVSKQEELATFAVFKAFKDVMVPSASGFLT
jgi:hypothetical protein